MENIEQQQPEKVEKDLLALLTDLPIWLVFAALAFIVLIPLAILIVRAFISNDSIDSLKPNEIGDMMGGITAPFVGVLNAVLVYHAFRQQLLANKLQREAIEKEQARYESQRDFEILAKLAEKIEERIKEISYTIDVKGEGSQEIKSTQFYGCTAINVFLSDIFGALLMEDCMKLSDKSKELLFNIDLETGQYSWKIFNHQEVFTIVLQNETEYFQTQSLEMLHMLNGQSSLLNHYSSMLMLVLAWTVRLQKSKMSHSDKMILVQVAMVQLVSNYFRLSSFIWLKNFLEPNDQRFVTISKMEESIHNFIYQDAHPFKGIL
jgi:hypothetical protein